MTSRGLTRRIEHLEGWAGQLDVLTEELQTATQELHRALADPSRSEHELGRARVAAFVAWTRRYGEGALVNAIRQVAEQRQGRRTHPGTEADRLSHPVAKGALP